MDTSSAARFDYVAIIELHALFHTHAAANILPN